MSGSHLWTVLCLLLLLALRRSIIVPGGGTTNEYRGGPGGPGSGFRRPGHGFSGNRKSGKPQHDCHSD